MLKIAGWIQLVGGLLIAFGFLTRFAAIISSVHMAITYFGHAAVAPTTVAKFFPILNQGELSAFYVSLFLFIFFYGPGRWSLDASSKSSARLRENPPAEPPGTPSTEG